MSAAPSGTARQLLDAFDAGSQIAPLSDSASDLTLARGYEIAAHLHDMRLARGEKPVGRKIGFTNRTIWDIYNVNAPIWGWVYRAGVHELPDSTGSIALPDLPELRIEPEIVFRFGTTPTAQMNLAELASCVSGIAHGFELVFSPFPGWRFRAPDTAAAFGLHAALVHGPFQNAAPLLHDDGAALSQLEITLTGGDCSLQGRGSDVLGGPLQALHFLLDELAASPTTSPLAAGDIVTTGTLTDAVPIHAGETWSTHISGVVLPGLSVTFVES